MQGGSRLRALRALVVLGAVVATTLALAGHANAAGGNLVLSQVYGGGGNSGAPYQNDYIEVFNRSLGPIDLTGMSVQYTSAAGSGNFGSASNLITPLSGMLGAGQYVLVQEASNAAVGAPLPTPFITDSTPINMSGTGGKVALANTTSGLGCNGGSTPCTAAQLAQIVDLIGYDGANFFEGTSAAPALSNTTAALRADGGCTDTDDNGADFAAGAPAPRTTASPLHSCAPPKVVVSQVYGGGGNSGATYTNDFIELFNPGSVPASVNGWSVQYASAAGTTWQVTSLTNVTLQPGQYYLVQEAQGAGGTAPLPTPDASGTIAMAATTGKVALVKTTSALSGSCPSDVSISDFVGYGTATCFEGSGPAPPPGNTTADLRNGSGCIDTDNNAGDFSAGAPTPRNTASPLHDCNADIAPSVDSTNPANNASGVVTGSNIAITFSEPVNVTGSWYSISCSSSGSHTATESAGPTTFTLDPAVDFAEGETCTVTVFAANVTDQDTNDPPDNMAADYVFSFATELPPTPIHTIQGAAHISPLNGQNVRALGTVTAKTTNGFWMQDPNPDADEATSEGIFVFTSSAPAVSPGDFVSASGRVQEFRPGGASTGNLTTTELSGPASARVISTGNPLPAPTVIGNGGRIPPNTVIEDDATGDVETSGVFDPATDGLDFFESLEGMRVQLNDAVAVGPTAVAFGETPVVGDNGANAGMRTYRGGLLLQPTDANPERITLDDLTPVDNANVGDHYYGAIVGVMDYNFGNPFLEVTSAPPVTPGGITREVTDPVDPGQLAISTFNFENLAFTDPQSKFDGLAQVIVNNLRSPDLLAGEEVQDNNGTGGPPGNTVVDASQTLTRLVNAISAAGGPTYQWREIDPVYNQDGGAQPGNIRQVILFRTDRGLSFTDRPGAGSTTPNAVVGSGSGTQLQYSPGRIAPTDAAWTSSRKPLAAELDYRGHHLFVIVNHFNSKGGDDPIRGHLQPPTAITEVQRHQQAALVANFVSQISSADPGANVVVLGDLNDFEFSQTVQILEGAGLHDLMNTLPLDQRYSYEFEGNAQVLDHIMFSGPLFARSLVFDPVHVNAEFWDQVSDHDPSVVRVDLNDPPSVSAGGPYSVDEGSSVTLSATGNDPEGGTLSYAWDLDGNGTFETPGQSVTFSPDDGPATPTLHVQVTDDIGQTAVDQVTVTVNNVAPTATFDAPASTFAGFPFTLSLTGPSDPSAADTAAGFTYAFDCGDGSGYGAFGSSSSASCPTTNVGSRSVSAKIKDKDGGFTEYHGTVSVIVTYDSLCALVRSYARHTDDADELCAILADAEAATNPKTRSNILKSFRNTVDGMTGTQPGKSFTSDQGALLKLLSTQL